MPIQKLKTFLDASNVKYTVIQHSRACTAQEIAEQAHIPGKELAKTVMVMIAGEAAMAVIPASHLVDFDCLSDVAGAPVDLADEGDFVELFPNCDVGAMPPFGNLYDMAVYVSESLAEDETIAFSAGLHSEVLRLHYADFERLVNPIRGRFSYRFP
ncbi:YbaK/EbsC family protein [Candidatus Bipolaricaulota bacterium]|nr:YbaK/EbsC family protein [Candidatus Bipolaricaulota bacterium]TFH09531.1 MAG: YbaK/EbsC family protein [Candidatus Atribacteria bacterium]